MSSHYEKILATGEVKCIDEEIPFEVPQGWEWCRLSHVAFSIADGDHMPPPKSTNGIPFLVISNIAKGGLDLNTTRFVPLSYYENISTERTPEYNDILFSVTGSYGIAVRITEKVPFCFQRHIALIKPIHIKSEFLEMLLNSPFIKSQCDEKATGMAQKTVGIDSLRNFLIPVPSANVQSKIIEKYKELLPLIDKYTVLSDKLEVLKGSLLSTFKKSILQEAIQGKLVHQIAEEGTAQDLLEQIRLEKQKLVKEGKLKKSALNDSIIFKGDDNRHYEKIGKTVQCIEDEIPFGIPESWVWRKFQDIANSELGKTMNKASDKGDEVPYLCSINVYWDKIDLSNVKVAPFSIAEKEKYLLQNGDLLICEGGEAGRCAIWSNDKTMYYQNALHRVRFYGNISSKFVQNIIRLYKIMGIIDKKSKGMTIKHFTKTALNSLYIPLPPVKEQQRIVAQIDKLFEHLR